MKKILKRIVKNLAGKQIVQSTISNLIYPTVVDLLNWEIKQNVSPSGIAESIAWKAYAYHVLCEELRQAGQDCATDGVRCDKETRARIIDVVLEHIAGTYGDIFEFGVFEGESLRIFAERCPERHVYGFDSFEGLPDDWWLRPKGTFKTAPPSIGKPNVTLVKGRFEKSVSRFLEKWSGRMSLIHVDCVLYKSTLECLLPIMPLCQTGTVILFDEYYNYPDFTYHEWLAWR